MQLCAFDDLNSCKGARITSSHLQRATADGETDIARLNRGMSIRCSKKHTNLAKHASRFAFPPSTAARRLHTRAVSARSESQCGRTRCPRKIVPQIETQRTTTKSATTATSLSQLSVNRSCRTYARCVWCSCSTCFCAVRAPAFLCFLRRLA